MAETAIDLARLESELLTPKKFERRNTVEMDIPASAAERAQGRRDAIAAPEKFCLGILRQAERIIRERAELYDKKGEMEDNFARIASLASLKLDREITPYMVAIILESVKDARRASNPLVVDTHVDGINYRAFAAQFALEKQPG